MRKVLQPVTFALGLLGLMGTSQPTIAQTAKAYVLVETTSNDLETLRSKLSHVGLANCKQLVEKVFLKELVMRIECNNLEDINKAVTDIVSGVDEIVRSTIWIIRTD